MKQIVVATLFVWLLVLSAGEGFASHTVFPDGNMMTTIEIPGVPPPSPFTGGIAFAFLDVNKLAELNLHASMAYLGQALGLAMFLYNWKYLYAPPPTIEDLGDRYRVTWQAQEGKGKSPTWTPWGPIVLEVMKSDL